MCAYYNEDAEIAWQKYHSEWMKEQNQLRKRVVVNDNLKFEMPTNVTIKYNQNSNFGHIEVVSRRRSRMRYTISTQAANDVDDYKQQQTPLKPLRYIGGVDISPAKPTAYEYDKACAGLMIYEYPSMRLVHEECKIVTLTQPYIAGFLAFREVEFLRQLINNVKKKNPAIVPQIILVDGNGILHYRRIGLATHLSLLVNIPCIGVAKRLLAVDGVNPDALVPLYNRRLARIGDFAPIHASNKEHIGYALRTHDRQPVVYVSPGNRVSHRSALTIVILCLDAQHRYKLPLPIEKADFITRKRIRQYETEHSNPHSFDSYQHRKNDQSRQGYQKRQTSSRPTNHQRGYRGRNQTKKASAQNTKQSSS